MTAVVALGAFTAGFGAAVLVLTLLYGGGGQHDGAHVPKHRGWEGREHELARLKAPVLLAREASVRWPSQLDTQRFEAVTDA